MPTAANPIARNFAVNSERLWASLMETAKFGGTPKGGVRRLALSSEDKQVREWLVAQATASGFETGVDDLGNIYIQRRGADPSRLPVAIGSHLDTQPTGGKFDGILGVLAGLEVLRSLDDAGIETEAPICLVNWTNEEGSRFAPGEMGSGVFAGDIERDFVLSRTDAEGITVAEALEEIGFRGPERCGERRFSAMLELHIEQGPVLEAEQVPIGVVTAAKGQLWFDGVVTGRESHAGTTPMGLRKDALAAFAEFLLAIERIATDEAPAGVGTIGVATVGPGSRNSIPGSVHFSLEFRHPDQGRLDAMRDRAVETGQSISRSRGCDVVLEPIWSKAPVDFSPQIADVIRSSADELALGSRQMISGAGHDACAVAQKAPTAMIFVPCKDGLSHNELESATREDCTAGANVLLRSVLTLAMAVR